MKDDKAVKGMMMKSLTHTLSSYICEDDIELSKDEFLKTVVDRIIEDIAHTDQKQKPERKCIVIMGTIEDGFSFYGPFLTRKEAYSYAGKDGDAQVVTLNEDDHE